MQTINKTLLISICAMLFLLSSPVLAAPLPDGDVLFAQLRAKYSTMYEKYKGIEVKRRSYIQRYDSKTKELVATSEVVVVVQEFFYKKPERQVLEFIKNGKKRDPDDFSSRESDPILPVLDADGANNYSLRVLGHKTVESQDCYELEVLPKEKTKRHFMGKLYVNAQTLDLVLIDGGKADLPFVVDALDFKIYSKEQGELSVPTKTTFRIEIDVPIVFSDVLLVIKTETLSARGILK
ncbi:hypothetical protein KAI87_16630 [Myxococcota bacterium]|nr:hypothetical protein [Myxococcota bacterium]